MSKLKTGVYAISWTSEDGSHTTMPIDTNAPDSVKRMIAQQILNDLDIKIRIES